MNALSGTVARPTRREDVLVSVCFAHLPADAASFKAVSELAHTLDDRFRFREIIVIAEDTRTDAFIPLLQRVDNLRLISVRPGTSFYRRRVIAADEAIGDVVLLTKAAELGHLDAVAMLDRATDDQCAVLTTRAGGMINRTLARPLVALGRVAGFHLALENLQTLALPRTLLNQLLGHPDPQLALRFPPRDARLPLAVVEAARDMPALREPGQLAERLALLRKLLVYVAPALLASVTLTSALLAALGLFYAIYILGAFFIVDDLEPGWLTLSAMLSMTAFFLGLSIMGLSLGLQQLLARTDRDTADAVTSELGRVDLFGQVTAELNVDADRDRPADRPDASGAARR